MALHAAPTRSPRATPTRCPTRSRSPARTRSAARTAPSRPRTRPSVDLHPALPAAGATPAEPAGSRCSAPSSGHAARPCPPARRERLRLPRVRATVRGRQIRRVTFFVDGRRVAIRKAKSGQRTFKARIRPGRLSLGVHRVTARVVFRTASRTPRAHAGAELPALRAPGPLAPVHRLMRVWLPALRAGRHRARRRPCDGGRGRPALDRALGHALGAREPAGQGARAPNRAPPRDRAPALADRGRAARGLRRARQPARRRARPGCRSASPGRPTAAPAGSAATRSAACTRSTPR